MKKALKVIAVVILLFIAVGIGGIIYLTRGLETGKKLEIAAVDPASKRDGHYEGSYQSGRWSNRLMVYVQSGKITRIEIEQDVVFKDAGVAEAVFDRVIAAQNTAIDTVSGATVTSKAYLKSIEAALNR